MHYYDKYSLAVLGSCLYLLCHSIDATTAAILARA